MNGRIQERSLASSPGFVSLRERVVSKFTPSLKPKFKMPCVRGGRVLSLRMNYDGPPYTYSGGLLLLFLSLTLWWKNHRA